MKRDYAGGMGVADPSPRTTFGHDPHYITLPYMSLLYATAVLEREGYPVTFLDAQAENLDLEALVARVQKVQPDVLVGAVSLPSIQGDLTVLRTLRERVPGLKTVAVGTVVQPLFDAVATAGAVDAAVRGDPEVILPELLPLLIDPRSPLEGSPFELRRGVLVNREVRLVEDLDALPDLPYHLVPTEKYRYHGFGAGVRYAAVFASRGCPYRCYYCPYPIGFGGRLVARNPVRVVDELERLYRNHGVTAILFRDQVFTIESERTHGLCDEILRRGLPLQWVVETRLDCVDEPLLRKMKAAGCVRIHYGLESGDPVLFSRVGKDQAAGRLEELIRHFHLTEQIGIHPHLFLLIGLKGETWESIRQSIATIRRLRPLTLQVSIVTPYPGTRFFEEAEREHLIVTRDWSHYTGFRPVARTESLTADDLLAARNKILRAHRWATLGKRSCRMLRLVLRYARDGTLPRRLFVRWRRFLSRKTGPRRRFRNPDARTSVTDS